MANQKPFPLPTGYFGIVLGLGALALAWRHVDAFYANAAAVSSALGVVASVLWALFMLMFGYKAVRYRAQLAAEYHHQVQFAFLSLVPITTIVIGLVLLPSLHGLGEGLVWIGSLAQVLFSFWRVAPLWKGEFCESAVLPPFYLPLVAANFSSASAFGVLGYTNVGYLFLGAGLIAWISYEPIILQRLRIFTEAPEIRPTMGILLAPAFVGASAYLTLNGGEVDIFAKLLWGYGVLQVLFLLRVLPWILEKGFVIGLWAFSFGLASLANSATHFYHADVLAPLAHGSFWFANGVIALLTLGTLYKVVRGEFFVK